MKANRISRQIVSKYSKGIILMFLLMLVFFASFSSFATAFVSTDYLSFSNSFSENASSLVDSRIIVGLKNNLAKKNADDSEQKKIGLRGALTSYGVGVNTDDKYFSIDSTTITPIESNLLSYIWSEKIEQNYLIQYISITRLFQDSSFDSKTNNVVISKTLYDSLGHPTEIPVYSYVIDSQITYNVTAYYENLLTNKLQGVFYDVYKEPVFFNNFGFKSLYNGKEDYYSNLQTDILFSSDSQYNDVIYNIFGEKHWTSSFIKYDRFDFVYSRMDQLNTRNVSYNVLIGFLLLIVLIFSLVLLFVHYRHAFSESILICNPIILLFLWGVVAFAVFGLSKLFKSTLLFFEPSVGVIFSMIVVMAVIQTVIYYFIKYKRKGQEDENSVKQ